MHFYLVLFVCAFALSMDFASCNREKVKEILEIVKRIEEHIAKEDRIREITDIIRIEQNVDRMNDKLDRVLNFLDNTVPPPIGRSSDGGMSTAVQSRDLVSSMEVIQSGLQSLELSVKGVEETMKKLDFDPIKVNEIERRTTQIKDDMNVKLRKTMNILSELYEMNKEMRSRALGLDENGEPLASSKPKSGESFSSSAASEFFVENLDEMERKIKEQFSILSSEIRSEVAGLKLVASSAGANCPTSPSEDDDEDEEWQTPRMANARSSSRITPAQGQAGRSLTKNERTLDNLMESLGRSTREIRAEIQQGIQGIDTKLQNLTAIAKSQPRCDLEVSESIVSPKRAVMPPEQSLRGAERRAKMDTCTKTVQNVPNPKSCADLKKGGATCDGIYVIFPKGRRAVRVLCDMTTEGGGWTVSSININSFFVI